MSSTLTSDLQKTLQETVGAAFHIDRELSGGGMSRVSVATEADVFGNNFYFTIGDRQSDVWTMELKRQ